MAKQVSKTVIGGFVISAIALLIIAVVVFGGGKFFTETEKYVLFFDRSVKGLNVGAPVVFRGVKIGSVDSVLIRGDTDKLDFDIPVFIEIELDRFIIIGETELPEDLYEQSKLWIDRGLRCQLAMESLVTGQLMVEMDFYPDTPARLTGIDLGVPELPTRTSEVDQLTQKLKKLPIEEIAEKLLAAIGSIEKTLSSPELMDTVRNLKATTGNANQLVLNIDRLVGDADKLVKNIDRQIDPLSGSLQAAIGDARMLLQNTDGEVKALSTKAQGALVSGKDALNQAVSTLNTYEGLVDERSALRNDLEAALNEIAQAARSIRSLTDYLEQHPEALLQGKGSGGGQ
jgi:paraquat-inducible protein B